LKNGLITPRQWEKLESWLEELGLKDSGVPIVGSGGNINKIFKLKRAKTGTTLLPRIYSSFMKRQIS
jgi:hypothetical protein